VKNPEQADGDLGAYLNDDECLLAVEGLHELLRLKREALNIAILHKVPAHRPFTAHDFGIPNVEELIKKLEGET
jgi:hypothetical protein